MKSSSLYIHVLHMGLPGVQNANNVCIGSLILNFCLY